MDLPKNVIHWTSQEASVQMTRLILELAHLDLRRHLLLLVSQLHAGALPGGEVLGGRNHLPVFELQVLHQQLQREDSGS